MRCKACDTLLHPYDFSKTKSKHQSEDEKYCTKCRFASEDIRPVKEYQLSSITESLVDTSATADWD